MLFAPWRTAHQSRGSLHRSKGAAKQTVGATETQRHVQQYSNKQKYSKEFLVVHVLPACALEQRSGDVNKAPEEVVHCLQPDQQYMQTYISQQLILTWVKSRRLTTSITCACRAP